MTDRCGVFAGRLTKLGRLRITWSLPGKAGWSWRSVIHGAGYSAIRTGLFLSLHAHGRFPQKKKPELIRLRLGISAATMRGAQGEPLLAGNGMGPASCLEFNEKLRQCLWRVQ